MDIVNGRKYKLNEDLKNLINSKGDKDIPAIPAGTECTVIEYDEEHAPYVTILVDGLKVRTEDHMLEAI